ncbi:MAG: hypothetical protein Q7R98_02970 [Candidatus Jorgensenbacteria bacterium]|nr:hypothetical protein [Candidatus Jorgensenbacteria bacterium]
MERKSDAPIYITIVVFAFLVAGGFLLMSDRIGSLSTDLKNTQSQLEMANGSISSPQTGSQQTNTTPVQNVTPQQTAPQNSVSIPTAIIFTTQSSPALSPQTSITVTVEDARRETDGTLTLDLKVFTDTASGYSAFDPKSSIEVLNLSGDNIKATEVNGQFASIPPKSAATGNIVFQTDASRNTVIIQIGSGDSMKFYEFNFTKKTYKETTVG